MKTYEVIKKLMEGSTNKFKDECGRVIGLHNGLISFFDKDLNFIEIAYFGYVEHDWQLVKQPVTWQEAIEEFAKGKKLVINLNNQEWSLGELVELPMYLNRAITTGKWYVED